MTTTTYLLPFSSGAQGAITATATFGDVVIIVLLFWLTLVSLVQVGVLWKLLSNSGSQLSAFSSWATSLWNLVLALWTGWRRPPDVG